MEFLISLKTWNFLGRKGFCQIQFSLIVCGVNGVSIFNQMPNNLIKGDIILVIIIWILLINDSIPIHIFRHAIRSATDISFRLCCPGISIFLHGLLLYRSCRNKGCNLIKEGTGATQLYHKGILVRCRNL